MLKEIRRVILLSVLGFLMIVGMLGIVAPIEPPLSPKNGTVTPIPSATPNFIVPLTGTVTVEPRAIALGQIDND